MDSRVRAANLRETGLHIAAAMLAPWIMSTIEGPYAPIRDFPLCQTEGTRVESNINYIQEETTMNETTNITPGTKEMPDHIYNLAVLAKKETEAILERGVLLTSSGKNPENYSDFVNQIGSYNSLVKYVLTNGSFSWDSRKGCWVFYYPATRDVMRDILKENPDLDMFADETSVKPPKRMCLRLSYVEEETRSINGYLKSSVTRTVVWEN